MVFSMAVTALGLLSPPEVLLVVGPSSHPPGTHEVAKTATILQEALNRPLAGTGLASRIVTDFPKIETEFDGVRTVVFLGDLFPLTRLPSQVENMEMMQRLVDRGVGVVCIHYATGVEGIHTRNGDHPLLRWVGGYFANPGSAHHESVARIFPAAKIEPSEPDHPVSRGWSTFVINDEPYIRNWFGPEGRREEVKVFAASMLPPEAPNLEPVAWGIQRQDGGRGFAVVMPHFVQNWQNDDLRTLILNGIVWTARREIPADGFRTAKPRSELTPAVG